MTKKNLEASIDVEAAPDGLWAVICDLKRMPEWSPQCRWMRVLGTLREGTYTINMNRQGHKFWPTASKVVRYEPGRAIAFRTLTNNSVWLFEIATTATGSNSPSAAWFRRRLRLGFRRPSSSTSSVGRTPSM